MSIPFKSWLAQQITSVDSVQKCAVGSGADIIVYSWRGIIIHVHIIDAPIKPRTIRRIVQEATRVGIGTLFVVHARLLPPDGARIVPDEWLLAIHTLMDDKIYTYREDDDGPHITQVHFRIAPKPDERDVWVGPDITIGQIPFFRVWVKMASIKGDYLIANFAASPFWRSTEYRSARTRVEPSPTANRSRSGYQRVEFGYGGAATPEVVPIPQTQLERSYAQLGLKVGVSCDEVKSAFRRLALEVHPDVSSLPKAEAETRFRALKDAFNYIRDHNGCG